MLAGEKVMFLWVIARQAFYEILVHPPLNAFKQYKLKRDRKYGADENDDIGCYIHDLSRFSRLNLLGTCYINV